MRTVFLYLSLDSYRSPLNNRTPVWMTKFDVLSMSEGGWRNHPVAGNLQVFSCPCYLPNLWVRMYGCHSIIIWLTKLWMDNPIMLRSDWIHFVFLNRIFCCIGSGFRRIGSAFRVTGMGVADWVESWLPKMALAVASCPFSAKANGYNWKWTVRERFKVLLSNETVAFLLGMVWRSSWRHSFRTELLSSLLIEEANARSYNKYIIALLRSGSTGEYSVLGFCIGPPYGRANTASLEPNIFLYCPPTRAIIYMFRAI